MNVASRLIQAGMSTSEAGNKAALFAAVEDVFGTTESQRWFVPGRIEVLGKHTDYAGGPVLVCAAERGICVAAAERNDSSVRVVDVVRRQTGEFLLSGEIAAPSGWQNYVATVVRRVARNFAGVQSGVDIAIASDLPQSAGMSSSSALIIAVFSAIAYANRLQDRPEFRRLSQTPEELAAYLACVENGQSYGGFAGDHGVGTFGGSEDHTAILCCRAGRLRQYRFCPVRIDDEILLPEDWTFAIASSGIRASKTAGVRDLYNRISLSARGALEEWNAASGRSDTSLHAAVHHSPNAKEQIRDALLNATREGFSGAELLARFDHYVLESELVVEGARAIAAADAHRLGMMADRSQAGAEQILGNQVAETMALARSARQLGAIAASAFGAGFGGSVWALVPRPTAHQFLAEWHSRYLRDYPGAERNSAFFLTGAGPGLTAFDSRPE